MRLPYVTAACPFVVVMRLLTWRSLRSMQARGIGGFQATARAEAR